MARPNKEGLTYFSLDCHMDDKIALIEAEFGLKGFAIVVKLWQKVYAGHGYYCEWNNDVSLLFARRLSMGGEKNLIDDVVSASIKRNIFSEELYQKYGILTSSGIQKRYLEATNRRGRVELKKEYLLVSVDNNEVTAYKNPVNVDINEVNVDNNPQIKVKESKVNKNNTCPSGDGRAGEKKLDKRTTPKGDFEVIYGIYPKKVGKSKAYELYLLWLKGRDISGERIRLTNKQIYTAVRKYVRTQEENNTELRFYKNFDTLLNKQILDYVEVG